MFVPPHVGERRLGLRTGGVQHQDVDRSGTPSTSAARPAACRSSAASAANASAARRRSGCPRRRPPRLRRPSRALTATASPSRATARDLGAQAARAAGHQGDARRHVGSARRRPAGGAAGPGAGRGSRPSRQVEVGDGQPLAVGRLGQDEPPGVDDHARRGSRCRRRGARAGRRRPRRPGSRWRRPGSSSQWSRPVTAVKAAGTTMISAPVRQAAVELGEAQVVADRHAHGAAQDLVHHHLVARRRGADSRYDTPPTSTSNMWSLR